MIVVVVDSAAQFHRSLRRKVAGLSQWERMRRTLRWSASVRDDNEARSAEDRLFRLVLKGKEERLGRWNRAISRPITRWLLPHPVSPNAVTLAGLLVSLGAGYFLALGSDRSLIAGTLLMVLSTALDSTDGMIARLKMEESQLGCWLETVTDRRC